MSYQIRTGEPMRRPIASLGDCGAAATWRQLQTGLNHTLLKGSRGPRYASVELLVACVRGSIILLIRVITGRGWLRADCSTGPPAQIEDKRYSPLLSS